MTLLPVDNNGLPIQAMAMRVASNHTLSGSPTEALSADDSVTRIVRLFATSAGVKAGSGTSPTAETLLMEAAPEYFELEAGQTLYASGSGTLNITIMG